MNTLTGNKANRNTVNGIAVSDGATYTTLTGNVANGNNSYGIGVYDARHTTVERLHRARQRELRRL